MRVTLVLRNQPGGYSLENVAQNIASHLPSGLNVTIRKVREQSTGLVNRLKIIREVGAQRDGVVHIMGDIHFAAFGQDKRRTVITMADCERIQGPGYSGLKKWIYKKIWFTWPAHHAAAITTISESAKRDLVRYAGIHADRITVIPIGIDDVFKRIPMDQIEKDRLLSNSASRPTVLHISNDRPNKNVNRLIDALAGLDVKFVKVGKLSDENMRRIRQCGLDHVQFTDLSDLEMARIYSAADCLAFPSIVEGFGLPVVEAQACGCPVITSAVSSLPEVAGGAAILVDPFAEDDIRKGVRTVLQNSEIRKGLIARGHVNAEQYSWKHVALLYDRLYRRISE